MLNTVLIFVLLARDADTLATELPRPVSKNVFQVTRSNIKFPCSIPEESSHS